MSMSLTIECALGDELIKNPRKLISEYQFTLGDIPTQISIRLYKPMPMRGEAVEFEQSHFLHTPTQAGPYRTSRPWGDDEADAVQSAIMTFTTHYQAAVNQGFVPSETWLVPNEDYRKKNV